MKKKCLFFAMALLAGAYTCKAHAKGDGQGENTETEQTTVDPTNIKTYGELKKAVEFLSTVSTDLGDPTVEENNKVFLR